MRLKLLPLLLLPLVAGCPTFLESSVLCDEFRRVEVDADLVGSGGDRIAVVSFLLTEERDSTASSYASLRATAPSAEVAAPLRGHIAKLRVLTGAGVALMTPDLPPVAAFDPSVTLFFSVADGLNHSLVTDLRQRMFAGDIRIEVTTDESPARVFLMTPHVTMNTDWQKVYCK